MLLIREVFYPLPYDDSSSSEWIFFVAAGLASVSVWLYAGSHGLARHVLRYPRLRERLDVLTPNPTIPPRRLGVAATGVLLVVFFGVVPLVRMSVRVEW